MGASLLGCDRGWHWWGRGPKRHASAKPVHGRDLLTPLGWGSQETAMTDQLGRITINPEICHGKPTIRGLRYPVEMVLELLSAGMSASDILADYSDLEAEDITAVLEYATHLSRVQRIDPVSA